MGRTCGEPDEIKKNTHPKTFTALFREQDTLVTAEAKRVLGPVPKPTRKIQYAIDLQEIMGEDPMYQLFVDIFMKAMQNRVNKVLMTDGIIGIWEFQTLLKELETPELNLLERREFLDIYGRKVSPTASNQLADNMIFAPSVVEYPFFTW